MVTVRLKDLAYRLRCGSRRLICLFILMASCLAFVAAGADAQHLSLGVNPTSGTVDDTFVFSVTLENIQQNQFPFLVGGDDFKLTLIGPETSITIVNGKTTSRISYNYRLVPKKEGMLETPSAEIEVNGQKVRASPLKVKVEKGGSSLDQVLKEVQASKDIFITQTGPQGPIYLGQQFVHTLEVYLTVNPMESRFSDLSFDGFWQEPLGDEQHFNRAIEGRYYNVVRLRKALFPLKSGTITISPRELSAKVPERRKLPPAGFPFGGGGPFGNDMFDDFFGSTTLRSVLIRSNPLDIHVKELPPAPTGFPDWGLSSVIVGKTSLSLVVPPGDLKLGESKTVEVEVRSTGNLNPVKRIPLSVPPVVKVYEEKPEGSAFEGGGLLVSRRVMRMSLVPVRSGAVEIPALQLGYFDPQEGKFKIASTAPIRFSVLPDSAHPEPTTASGGIPGSKDTGPKVAGGPTPLTPPSPTPFVTYSEPTALEKLGEQVSTSLALLLLAGIAALGLLIAFAWRLSRRGKSEREQISRILAATTHDDLNREFRSFISTKLGLTSNSQEREVLSALIENGVANKNLQFGIQSLLDDLEGASYGDPAQKPALAPLRERAGEIARRW